jgi:predicted nuclease of predicted toxin-antitoxin system
MRFLLDMSVSPSLAEVLARHGHEAEHAYRIGMGRAKDEELLAKAREMGGVVVTVDLDFPRLLAQTSADGPGVILFRGGNYSDSEMRSLLERVLLKVSAEMLQRSICVVDRQRVRVTRLPLMSDPEGQNR